MEKKYISSNDWNQEIIAFLTSLDVIFIDTETVNDKLFLLQIGNEQLQYVINANTVDLSFLRKIVEGKIKKVGHNLQYDYKILFINLGWVMNNTYDTMVVEQLIDCGRSTPTGYYSLEQCGYRYSGINPYSDQLSLFDPFIPKSIRNKPSISDEFIHYAAIDLVTTYRVYTAQQPIIKERKMSKLVSLENEYTLVLADKHIVGFPLSIRRWAYLDRWINRKVEDRLQKLRELYPQIENWNSQKQVSALFKELGMDIVVRDKIKSLKERKDIYKDSIQEIVISKFRDDYPIVSTYLEYKKFKKLSSTYGLSFLKHVNPETGRIHSSFFQILNTGRISSSSPNMQNIVSESDDFPEGKLWREAFRTKEGRTFIIADYGSQEMRVLADKANESSMIEAFKNNLDLHSLTASKMYKKEVSKTVNANLRKNGKIVNFLIP